ncbi:MAG: transposase, partial [Spirochaetes bacterium]|nr:transposase [Spirochaetota bacterium]
LEKIRELKSELNKRIKTRSCKKGPSEIKKMQETMNINETDSDSEFSKMKDGSRRNAYTKVCATDSEADIIVGSGIQGHYDEKHMLMNVTKDANHNCKEIGKYETVVADSNFITMSNCIGLEASGIKLIGPTQRHETEQRNSEKYKDKISFDYDEKNNCIKCSEGYTLYYKGHSLDSRMGAIYFRYSNEDACKACKRVGDCINSKKGFREVKIDTRHPSLQRVLSRYKSEEGQTLYEKRCHTAEVFQGDLQHNGRFRQFLRKGIEKVRVDSILHDIVWNLRRTFNSTGNKLVWQK